MRYLGGKTRIAAGIARALVARSGGRTRYVEPFLGAGAVAAVAAPHFTGVYLADIREDLVMLWNEVRAGWVPPVRITKAAWLELKNSPPSARRAFAGFAASYGGRFFTGYEPGPGYAHLHAAVATLTARAQAFGTEVVCADYRDAPVDANAVVYADPPYAGTEGIGTREGLEYFDHEDFWVTMNDWTDRGALVAVSEYSAPPDWGYAWRARKAQQMHNPVVMAHNGYQTKVGEYLFVREGGYARVGA